MAFKLIAPDKRKLISMRDSLTLKLNYLNGGEYSIVNDSLVLSKRIQRLSRVYETNEK